MSGGTIAFVGIGLMGAPMATRLAGAGYRVVAWNRTRAKLEALAAVGVVAASSPAEATSAADCICLSLADSAAVEQVLFQPRGVAASGRPPQLLIDFSTSEPVVTRALAARLKSQCGMHWVDCPVSGGVSGARAGTLVAFCGGEEEDIARARDVLAPLTRRINHLGPLGAGQAAKLASQLIVATNLMAIAEALSLARASGLDMRKLPDALTGGFADSAPLQIFGRRMACGITEPKLGEISLMLKDIEAAVGTALDRRSPVPLGQHVRDLYRRARAQQLGAEDVSALIRLYEAAE
jgi:3-hydroxyisobutyrate dehydrogenase-like beta-hydroxyacid dehydrogenase